MAFDLDVDSRARELGYAEDRKDLIRASEVPKGVGSQHGVGVGVPGGSFLIGTTPHVQYVCA